MKKALCGLFVVACLVTTAMLGLAPSILNGMNLDPCQGFWVHTSPSDSNHWGEFEELFPGLPGQVVMARILRAVEQGEGWVRVVRIAEIPFRPGTYIAHLNAGGTDVYYFAEEGRRGTMFVPKNGASYIDGRISAMQGNDVTNDPAANQNLRNNAGCRANVVPASLEALPMPKMAQVPVPVMQTSLISLLALVVAIVVIRRRSLARA